MSKTVLRLLPSRRHFSNAARDKRLTTHDVRRIETVIREPRRGAFDRRAVILGCVIEPIVTHAPFIPALAYPMIVVVIAANALRWWCIATLGPRWSARVIVIPDKPLVHDLSLIHI